jgi:aminopeptidase N
MRPAFAGDIAASSAMPHYELQLWLDPAAGVISGTEQITLTSPAREPLAELALRLYPNFPKDVFGKGGDVQMQIGGAAVNGRAAEPRYAAQRTAALLPIAPPLAPGATASVSISFTATIRPWRDGSWPLPSYYPMLAAYDAGGWRLDVTRFADHVYADSAVYAATISAPSDLTVVASGSTVAAIAGSDGRTTWRVRSGPVREFALAAGRFAEARAAAGDVAVNVYAARSSQLDRAEVARVAAGALADFDRRFGAYPYAELDILLLPYEYDGGDEYPGLIIQYADGPIDAGARYVTAHEVAHQWWYGVVGNDIYRQPWLDEALAQYSAIIYAEDVAGAGVTAADWKREVLRRYRGALADGDMPAGLGIDGYPSFNVYYRTVYGKGAVFLRALRDQLDDDAFFQGLRLYAQRARYRVASTRDALAAFEDASGQDLRALFERWLGPIP